MAEPPGSHGAGPTGWADVVLFARSHWRSTWRTLSLLTVAVALVATVVLTAATGARRSPGAFDRLRAATDAADLHVALSTSPTPATLKRLEQVDGVAAAAAQPTLWVRPVGTDLYPGYHILPIADDWQHTRVNRPIVVEGRAPDAAMPTEIAISQSLADTLGVQVGDGVALEALTESQLEALNGGAFPDQLAGPHVDATVVGILQSPVEFGRFRFIMYLSPGLIGIPAVTAGAELRLTDPNLAGDRAFAATLDDALAAIDDGTGPYGRAEQPTQPSLFEASPQSDDALHTIGRAMWIVVAISLVAGAIAILQLGLRSGRSTMSERTSLTALGWTQRRRTMAVLLTTGPWLAAGVLVALPAAVMLSPVALVGLAAQVDPTPNARVLDGAVLGLGGAAMLVVVAVLGFIAASVASKTHARAPAGGKGWMSIGPPLVPRLGLLHAFGGPAGPGRRSTRTAVGLAALTIIGVLAALSVSASIDRLQTDQTLLGGDDTRSVGGEGLDNLRANLAILEADLRVDEIEHDVFFFGPTPVDHPDQPLAIVAIDIVQGTFRVRLPKGRLPVQSDEITLGPALLERLGLDVGDEIVLYADGSEARYHIVGSALGPESSVHFDEYAAMTFAASDRLIGSTADNADLEHQLNFGYVRGTDVAAADEELRARGLEIFPPETGVLPASVANLGQVAGIPIWIAVYLAILGLTALAHGLIVAVSSRHREFTVMRALGLRRSSAVAIVAYQGLAMAAIAALVGFPVGMLVSRQLWQRIATNAHVVVETVWPWRTIVVLGPAALAATSAIGFAAAARSMHRHKKLVLGTE